MKKINLAFLASGLLIAFLGVMLFLRKDFFITAFGAESDPRLYWGIIGFIGVIGLTGLSLMITSFRFPKIKSYPAWFSLMAYLFFTAAGYIGGILLPRARGDSAALNKLLIVMVALMILGLIAIYVFIGYFPKELRKAKNVRKKNFDTEEAVDMIDKFIED